MIAKKVVTTHVSSAMTRFQ